MSEYTPLSQVGIYQYIHGILVIYYPVSVVYSFAETHFLNGKNKQNNKRKPMPLHLKFILNASETLELRERYVRLINLQKSW